MTAPVIPGNVTEAREAEKAAGKQQWILMIFTDGKEKLGCAVIQAFGPVDAHAIAIESNIDPGRGSITMMPLAAEHLPPEDKRGRLMTFEEAEALWPAAPAGQTV